MNALNITLSNLTGTVTLYFLIAIFGFYMMESLNAATEKYNKNPRRRRVRYSLLLVRFVMVFLILAGTLLLFPIGSELLIHGFFSSLLFLLLVGAHVGLVAAVIAIYFTPHHKQNAPLIVRTWRGSTSQTDADRYFEYLKKTGVKEYQATPGNKGVLVLRRIDRKRAEFLLLSLWESKDAIKAFAGPEPDKAVFYPEDEKFLVEFDRKVKHYDMLLRTG